MILLGKNYDSLSLVVAILDAAGSGSTKTNIMNMANLSFKLLKKYLAITLNLGFVKEKGTKYMLTDQGREFLTRFEHFQDKYNKVERELSQLMIEREIMEQICRQNSRQKCCASVLSR